MKSLYLAVLLSLLSLTLHAELYQWVDEEGNVQYSQTPPPEGTEATVVSPSPVQTISAPEPAPQTKPNSDTELPPSAAENTPEEPAQKNAQDALTASCQEAEKQLQLLQSGDELMIPDQDNSGAYKPVSPEIREQKVAKTQEYIDNYCTKKNQP